MPVTVWVSKQGIFQTLPRLQTHPGFDDIIKVSTRRHWFICIRLQRTYLTKSSLAFSITLTTMAFDQSSLWWFGITTCIASPRGPPSSSLQHSYTSCNNSCRMGLLSWHTVCTFSGKGKV